MAKILKRDFILPEEDKEFLDASYSEWESVIADNNQWLLVNNFKIPDGYLVKAASLAINIPSTYPDTNLDMAYFHPPLHREDGSKINATESMITIEGREFQRWSRHYEWRPGIDSLRSHLIFVEEWLIKEFCKGMIA